MRGRVWGTAIPAGCGDSRDRAAPDPSALPQTMESGWQDTPRGGGQSPQSPCDPFKVPQLPYIEGTPKKCSERLRDHPMGTPRPLGRVWWLQDLPSAVPKEPPPPDSGGKAVPAQNASQLWPKETLPAPAQGFW